MFGCSLLNSGLRTRQFETLLFVIATLLLSSCSSSPENLPADKPVVVEDALPDQPPPVVEETPKTITHGLDSGDDIVIVDDPWELVREANVAPADQVPGLLIRAINEFLDQGQIQPVQSISNQLEGYPLSPDQQLSHNLINARIATKTDQPDVALKILDSINPNQIIDQEARKQILSTKSEAQLTLSRISDAAASLLLLDPMLEGDERIQNQRQILLLLQSMDALHISLLNDHYHQPDLAGWIDLSEVVNESGVDTLQTNVEAWRRLYPGHPLMPEVLGQLTGSVQLARYQQIGLLLPLTSSYGNAARAFYDGFTAAHSRESSIQSPQIVLYDIGNDPELSSLYYQAAINDGADFIVGPLGRNAADSLMKNLISDTDTLVIADIPPQYESLNLYGINLSPEAEARQVADKAFADGHRQATVLRISSSWGQRVATAFVTRWESLGGVVVKNSSFPKEISDYTRIIEKFLGLNNSIARYKMVQAQSDLNLKFTPRRNEDMDFLFLAASHDQARLVVPQLRFFQAHDLPLYATSYAYSGKPEPAVDADLDGLIFGEMPWMIEGVAHYKTIQAENAARREEEKAARTAAELESQEPQAPTNEENNGESGIEEPDLTDPSLLVQSDQSDLENALQEEDQEHSLEQTNELSTEQRRPYQGTSLDRLYALGLQSYEIIPRLTGLRANQWSRFVGQAMTVSVNQSGVVQQFPIWVTFKKGLLEPLTPQPKRTNLSIQQQSIQPQLIQQQSLQ